MSNIKWVQWTNNSGLLKAHAINLDTVGDPIRTVTGSLVPDSATDAATDTPRDTFSLACVEKLDEKAAKRAEALVKAQARAEAKAAGADAKKAAFEAKKLVWAEAAAAKKLAKAEAKAAAAATIKVTAPPAPKVKKPFLRIGKKVIKVVLGSDVVGEFAADKLIEGKEHVVKVTEKSWAVYQETKRVAMGLLQPKAETNSIAAPAQAAPAAE